MEFKIINEIKKHDSFDKLYMESLYVCEKFLTKDEIKNHKYCSEHCQNKCFTKQKAYFQQYIAEIRTPELIYIEKNLLTGNVTYIKPTSMNARYKAFPKFINIWMQDTGNSNYEKMDFYPDKSKVPKNTYNTFNGFAIDHMYVTNSKEKKEEFVAQILKHFDDVFETKEIVNYIIKHFAHIIQYPMDKVGVSIVIQGSQGSGKSFIIDNMLAPIVGDSLYLYTCKPGDIVGDHAEGSENKLIVTLDEVSGKSTFDVADILKSLVTQTRHRVNPKGVRPYNVSNHCVYYFTTNSKVPIKVEIDDRRYFATRMLNTYTKNVSYYKKLSDYMKRPEVLSAWYDYLKELDVKGYDFINNRPFSSIYNDMKEACLSNVTRFINDIIVSDPEQDKKVVVSAEKVFSQYMKWKESTNHKDDHNSTSFGREMSNIQGIKKDRKSSGVVYTIDIEELKSYFASHNLFGYCKKEGDAMSEIEQLKAIIERQQNEIESLKQILAQNKEQTVNINIEFNNGDKKKSKKRNYDNDDDSNICDYITSSFFSKINQPPKEVIKVEKPKKQLKEESDIDDDKPKKAKKVTTPTAQFADIANEMLDLI
jgi:hypothetical protein